MLASSPSSKNAAIKATPLCDVTNSQPLPEKIEELKMDASMKIEALRIVRKHTKFDDEGNICETIETEIVAEPSHEEEPASATAEDPASGIEISRNFALALCFLSMHLVVLR
jgi:hypothetical protein